MPSPDPAARSINTVTGKRPSNGWAALLARRLFPAPAPLTRAGWMSDDS